MTEVITRRELHRLGQGSDSQLLVLHCTGLGSISEQSIWDYDGQIDHGTGFSPSNLVFFTVIIPPVLHIHISFICH